MLTCADVCCCMQVVRAEALIEEVDPIDEGGHSGSGSRYSGYLLS